MTCRICDAPTSDANMRRCRGCRLEICADCQTIADGLCPECEDAASERANERRLAIGQSDIDTCVRDLIDAGRGHLCKR